MRKVAIVDEISLKDKIHSIRGQEVMLDFDLAEIYGYTTSAINQQVSRNMDRFEEDFYFQLSDDEWANLMSQNVISKHGGLRKIPHVFTEQGIYMLMTVLKGGLAVKQSKELIRTFKKMKDYLIENNKAVTWQDFSKVSEKVNDNSLKISSILSEQKEIMGIVKSFSSNRLEKTIVDGEYFDADFIYKGIYASAKKSIVIIDNYVGLKTLVLLKDIRRNVKCTIFSQNLGKRMHPLEIEDFNKQYPNVNVSFREIDIQNHDRFIVIDFGTKDEKIYHAGGSSKDAGKKKTIIVEIRSEKTREMVEGLLNSKC